MPGLWLLDGLQEWIKNIIIDSIINNLHETTIGLNFSQAEILKTPSSFNSNILGIAESIHTTAIMPVASIIVAAASCMSLINIIIKNNNLHEVNSSELFIWITKVFCLGIATKNSFKIVLAFFDLSSEITSKVFNASYSGAVDLSELLDSDLRQILSNNSIGELLSLQILSFITSLVVKLIFVLIMVVIFGRFIEIYIVSTLCSIPFATMGYSETKNIGINYIKSIASLALQGVMIGIIIRIYQTMISHGNLTTFGNLMGQQMLAVLIYSIVVGLMILKTGQLSKSIMNAQ